MNIFVSSLSFKCKKEDLENLFAPYCTVYNARIITNKTTHRSKGYGFVEIDDEELGKMAIAKLNGTEHMGRIINVEVANPIEPKNDNIEERAMVSTNLSQPAENAESLQRDGDYY